jgi:hypothetical protein
MDILFERGSFQYATTYVDDPAGPHLKLWEIARSEKSRAQLHVLTAWKSETIVGAITLNGTVRELPLEVIEAFVRDVRRRFVDVRYEEP